jgi:FkbM family methyltransferase
MTQSFKSRLRRWTPDAVYFYYRVSRAPKLYQHEFEILCPLLDRNRNVIDAGAHIGLFSRFFAANAKQVYSFEPDPVVYAMLKRFAPANVTPLNLALSDHAGTASLTTAVKDGTPCRGNGSLSTVAGAGDIAIQVPLARLDDQGLRDVQLIKIDVEGHELSVLRGGSTLLREQRPRLWVEIEQHFHPDRPLSDVFREVESYGYRGDFFDSTNRKHATSEFVFEQHQSGSEYCNNFLFNPVP